MFLQEIFAPERIKIDLEAEDKEEAFEELVDLLVRSYRIECRDEILAVILDRESKMSTGIKKWVAIPHGRTDCVKGICGVIGICSRGIAYDSLDGEDVRLIFLLVSSQGESDQHLRVLKKIAHCLESPDFIDEILKAANPRQINEIIRRYEEMLGFQES